MMIQYFDFWHANIHSLAVAIIEEKEDGSHKYSRGARPIEICKSGYVATYTVKVISAEKIKIRNYSIQLLLL